ncbi:hypothetical protein GLAREA_05250 [Glarea lozoyensis ATCC 20868]|uniref:Uncharacterized protein n=1 Tax=Glarea lozoyensis (strain ATCC 20868 / MF5171) TaxID=1116229 RepID=S3DBV9_GLAL2|nr:uncharacterized protein GLAREA_05250 [Glarea lozoyensis ATCC 20868]EPE35912.1 hypothetical protein GLAREA_05250 [Glarea lozoyensis ATCC 20868]
MNSTRRNSEAQQDDRPVVKITDLCVGCIVWLPAKSELNGGIKCTCTGCIQAVDLEDPGYNHPVLVVRIQLSDNLAETVCDVLTTFTDTSISKYIKRINRNSGHPIEQSISVHHPESEAVQIPQLHLEKGKLRKQSYLRLQHVYEVKVTCLRTYNWRYSQGPKLRLREESYEALMGRLGADAEEWVETDMVASVMRLKVREAEARTPRTQRALLASVPAGDWPSVSGRTIPTPVTGLQRSYSAAAAGRMPQPARVPQTAYIPVRYPQSTYGSVGVQQGSYGSDGVYQYGYAAQQPNYTYVSPVLPVENHTGYETRGAEDAPSTPEDEGPGWGLTIFVSVVVCTVLYLWKKL